MRIRKQEQAEIEKLQDDLDQGGDSMDESKRA